MIPCKPTFERTHHLISNCIVSNCRIVFCIVGILLYNRTPATSKLVQEPKKLFELKINRKSIFWELRLSLLEYISVKYCTCTREQLWRLVKPLACRARGPGFDSRPRHLNFQRLVISCLQIVIWLKYRWSDLNPQYNKPTNYMYPVFQSFPVFLWQAIVSC